MVSGKRPDRRRAQHERTAALIVDAAWQLAEEHGVGGLSVGDLARRLEMRPQSLYTYFPSKLAIYDAMYRQGFTALLARLGSLTAEPSAVRADPAKFFAAAATAFVDFAVESPSRYQLLFQRTVPGFEPSPESYAVAIEALSRMRGWLAAAGIKSERHLDLWRALLLGLAGEQLANDVGGQRWRALAAETARFFVTFTQLAKGTAG